MSRESSDRAIGNLLGVSPKTVAAARRRLNAQRLSGDEIPQLITNGIDWAHYCRGRDGKIYPRKRYPNARLRGRIAVWMREQGWGYQRIADALGVSYGTAYEDVQIAWGID